MELDRKITDLKGVGQKTEEIFQKLGVYTIGDILLYFPRTYLQYPNIKEPGNLVEGETAAVYGRLKTPIINKKTRRMDISFGTLYTETEPMELIWYRSPFVRSSIKPGWDYVFYGKVTKRNHMWTMEQAKAFTYDAYVDLQKKLQPQYALTKGATNHQLTKVISQSLCFSRGVPEYLNEEERKQLELCEECSSVERMHFPEHMEDLTEARKRQVFDEFFRFFYYVKKRRMQEQEIQNDFLLDKHELYAHTLQCLPFALTKGQKQVLQDCISDFQGPLISERLIQGDVGSGKTMLAFLSMLYHVENGYQTAIMAPTEVLARQHYETFLEYKERFQLPYEVVCLTGSTPKSERKRIHDMLQRKAGLFVIGTQALLQDPVTFTNLSLVVTDEQHRFGVKQRKNIADKGGHPFVLLMSATPIPRSLGMILYGDLHVSVMTDLPAKRLPIKNAVMKKSQREKVLGFVLNQVRQGHQAYMICPLVECSEPSDLESAVEYKELLEVSYGDEVTVGLLHGKMKSKEKNDIMERFSSGEIQVLVSTTVVEVGVNVPNATVMVIEDAHRFGLAQLHQLRGRVGRGAAQSYCIFLDGSDGEEIAERLAVIGSSNDGFYIANEDLKMRGPGDFLGIRQSGEMNFRVGDIYQDSELLKAASNYVDELLQKDPDLKQGNHGNVDAYLFIYESKIYTNL